MKKIGIVTDSHSSISQEEAKKLGIFVLPMPFYIDGECYYESVTLSRELFFEKLTSGADISTSQPSPTAVMEIWDKALEEYEKILYGYWEAVAAQEGTSYADLFLTEGESAENIASKRVDLIAKYSDAIPVELVTVSDFQTYEVLLSFNGKTISADGYEDFHFVIDNKDDNWKVLQGLSWAAPYPEDPTGD